VTTLTATVADVHRITPDVKQFRLVAEEHGFEYEPGGHTVVHFESDGEEEARPYLDSARESRPSRE
jgi:ferredoxin-NADP reductase